MFQKKKRSDIVFMSGITLAVVGLAVGSASFVSLQGQVGGFNCSARPAYTQSWYQSAPPFDRFDVDQNGAVNDKDAKIVGDLLAQNKPERIIDWRNPSFLPPPYIDVNGDYKLTSNDKLLLVNYVNNCTGGGGGGGSGEGGAVNRWRNSANPKDVNGDNKFTHSDVLMIINEYNSKGWHSLDPNGSGPPYLDVDGNKAFGNGDWQSINRR